MTEISERVRWLRASTGLTARAVGDLAGLSAAQITALERGQIKSPGSETLAAISRVFGCSIDWLVLGSGTVPTESAVVQSINAHRLNPAQDGASDHGAGAQ